MSAENTDPTPQPGGARPSSAGAFQTTDWSLVVDAGVSGELQRRALERLCRAYWLPTYGFIRQLGHDAESAKDLTQAFFAHLLAHDFFATADRERGRFRNYLRQSCRLFLGNAWRKRTAEKRGGGLVDVPWSELTPDEEAGFATSDDPGREFDRRWALALLRNALARLEAEHATPEAARTFALLRPFLTARPDPGDYARIAGELGLARGHVPVLVHRLTQRYSELIRAEVAATVATRADIDAELRHCLQALG